VDSYISWFIHGLLLVPVTLLPIINPLSSAPVFAATVGTNRVMAKRLARQVAINAWFVVLASMLIGTYVLALFGISLPVVRIGGGLLVAATAWHMLHHTEDDDVQSVAAEEAATLSDDDVQSVAAEEAATLSETEILQRSFFPITFPLTTGPGTIATSIALGAKIPPGPVTYALGVLVAAFGAALVSLALYLVFKNSVAVLARLGRMGTLVMVRMMAFILLCIGIQIMWTGWAELNGLTL
jgi:multiple antibiotic resistance protein